jgi:hypothetical protein
MRHAAGAVLLPFALLYAPPVWAQPYDPASAESVFREAKASVQRGDFKTACPQFAESQRLDPAPGTLLNLGACEEHLGAIASAWGHFVEARDQLAVGDDRLAFARQRIDAIAPRVPHLVVRLAAAAPSGTRVMRGSIEIGTAALGVPMAVDPGELTLTATAPGGATTTKTVTLREGATTEVTLDVVMQTVQPPADPLRAPGPTTDTTPRPSGSDPRRPLGWIVGGVGVAGVALGAVAGIVAIGDANTFKRDCTAQGLCQSQAGVDAAAAGKTTSTLSTVALIGGAVATGVGVYLLLSSRPSQSATVGVLAIPGGASVVLGL